MGILLVSSWDFCEDLVDCIFLEGEYLNKYTILHVLIHDQRNQPTSYV